MASRLDLEDWREVARAHGEVFGTIRPANTLVQVAGLVDERLVEIEADAVIPAVRWQARRSE